MFKRPEEELSLFGEFVEGLCDVLGVSESYVAKEAGVLKSTLSANKRDRRPTRDAVDRLWRVFARLMVEQGKTDLLEERITFYSVAGWPTEEVEYYLQYRIRRIRDKYPEEENKK